MLSDIHCNVNSMMNVASNIAETGPSTALYAPASNMYLPRSELSCSFS